MECSAYVNSLLPETLEHPYIWTKCDCDEDSSGLCTSGEATCEYGKYDPQGYPDEEGVCPVMQIDVEGLVFNK